MSGMSEAYRNIMAQAGASAITHIGLVEMNGVELSSSVYSRRAASWGAPNDGKIQLTANLEFNIAAGESVGGWRGFSAAIGGINYGGADVRLQVFSSPGIFILFAADTWIKHRNPSSVRWW